MSTATPVRVALAGCGTVGAALVRLMQSARIDGANPRFELVRVLVRDPSRDRGVTISDELLTTDPAALVDADVDVVVEALGGLEPAGAIARAVVERGGRLVTANKMLLARCGGALAETARARGGAIAFEGAVGGGVPAVQALRSLAGGPSVRRVTGILNGTANYVLSRLERGDSYDAALAGARARGLAEADPSRDLDGSDAADKIALLAWIAFGVAPERVEVRRRGLLPDPERLVREALAEGERLRLVAECVREGNRVSAVVEPRRVPPGSPLGTTVGEENRVEIDLGWCAPLTLSGPGAGGDPTAAAVWGDLLACAAELRAARRVSSSGPRTGSRSGRTSAARGVPVVPLGAARTA